MEATSKFRFSEDHLLTSMRKYREQTWWRRPFIKYRWPIVVASSIGLAYFVHFGSVYSAGISGGIVGALLLGWPIDSWIIRRRFRKSPYYNDDLSIRLAESGFHAIGQNTRMDIGWSTYTKARRFKDGLLLLQGPYVFNWLPDEAATEPSMVDRAEKLAREHVADFRNA